MDLEKVKAVLGDRFSFTADDTQTAIDHLMLPESARVLDVGTGVGNMAIMLALNGYHVITGEPAADDSKYAGQDWRANAMKVHVDHLIRFEPFDAANMPFGAEAFDGIFFLGSLHHIAEQDRAGVMHECVRTARAGAGICFLEPGGDLIRMIRESDPGHPDASDPNDYASGTGMTPKTISGRLFNIFLFRKPA